ncbi:hypothetical protein [Pendulispora albinea]|uniref:STAS/SEC14 domain-containing protein n=1 Tax=Pendulispora albinea TaxID=2741071 RepID=A0ABZ2LP29_9BACT
MISRVREVGRLIELRYVLPIQLADLDERALASWIQLLESVPRPVVCIDVRDASVLSPELADRLAVLMDRTRGLFARAAEIVSPSTSRTFLLQLDRIARQTADPARRIFTDPRDAIAWLDEVLEPDERARLRAFLARRNRRA